MSIFMSLFHSFDILQNLLYVRIFVFILHVETSFWRLLVDIIVQVMLCNFDQAAICAVSESSGNIHVYWFCRMLSAWFSQVSPVTQRNCLLRKHFFLWKMFPTCWWYLFWWMVKVTCVFSDYKQWLTSLVRPSLQCISYSSGVECPKCLSKGSTSVGSTLSSFSPIIPVSFTG